MSFSTPSKTTTIAAFRRRYPSADSTWAGELYDKAYNWACDLADIRFSSITITIVADTREYDIPNTCLHVEAVEWWTDADTYVKVRGVSRQKLDDTRRAA